MAQVLFPAATHDVLDSAAAQIENRSPLYDVDENKLYIKYNDKLNPLSSAVDNRNIIYNEKGEIALNDYVKCKGLAVAPDASAPVHYTNLKFAETTPFRTIILLMKLSEVDLGSLSGNLYEKGRLCSTYHFAVSSTGSRFLSGSSSVAKANYVKATLGNKDYIGIKFPSTQDAILYFSGYDSRTESNLPPVYNTYTDADLINIRPIVDDSSDKAEDVIVSPSTNKWNPFKYTWEFTDKPAWAQSDTVDFTYTNPDLGNGLYVSSSWLAQSALNKAVFHINETVSNNKGYLEIHGRGKFLKITNNYGRSSLRVIAASGKANTPVEIKLYNSDGYYIQKVKSNSIDNLVTLAMNIDAGIFYIGSDSDLTRIYMVDIDNPGNDGFILGWQSFQRNWLFTTLPYIAEEASLWNGDFGEGLIFNMDVGAYTINTDKVINNNKGYLSCTKIISQEAFYLFIDKPETQLKVLFNQKNLGNKVQTRVAILNSKGEELTFKLAPKNGATANITIPSLGEGRYIITTSGNINFMDIVATNLGKDNVQDTTPPFDKVDDIINNDLQDTGEDGDPHHIVVEDSEITFAELQQLAKSLRNSDKQVSVDLSKCKVAADAKKWDRNLFNKCVSLETLKMPQGVEEIGANCFGGCIFLRKIEFPSTLLKVSGGGKENTPFNGVKARTYVFPDSFTSFSSYSFANSAIRNVVLSPGIAHPKSIFGWGSMYDTFDYVKVYMTQAQYDADQWSNSDYGDKFDSSAGSSKNPKDSFVVYQDLDTLLKELKYYDER